MRFHLTSLDRAKLVAKNLRRIVGSTLQIELSQTAARQTLARMLGYRDWAELKLITERHDQAPSPFDELLEPDALRTRLGEQAKILGVALKISELSAAWIVADLRATAHPAGPHRVFGPSSLPPPWAIEYRGVAG